MSNATEVRLPKPHFAVLDGLRGVAAVGVVTFHFMEMVIWNYSKLWIGHGFLAVDFFFCPLGFCDGLCLRRSPANDGALELSEGAADPAPSPGGAWGDPRPDRLLCPIPFGVTPGYGWEKVALMLVASLLLIPYGVMKERGQNLFSLNAPAWSLFWESMWRMWFSAWRSTA